MLLVVLSSKVVKAMAKLQSLVSKLFLSTSRSPYLECCPPLGRVVLGGVGEQLLVPGLLLMAGPSWRHLGISLKPVPEQAVSYTDEKGESFQELGAAAATQVSRAK